MQTARKRPLVDLVERCSDRLDNRTITKSPATLLDRKRRILRQVLLRTLSLAPPVRRVEARRAFEPVFLHKPRCSGRFVLSGGIGVGPGPLYPLSKSFGSIHDEPEIAEARRRGERQNRSIVADAGLMQI